MDTIIGLLHQLANSAWREPTLEKVIETKISKATPRRVDIQADLAVKVLTVYIFVGNSTTDTVGQPHSEQYVAAGKS